MISNVFIPSDYQDAFCDYMFDWIVTYKCMVFYFICIWYHTAHSKPKISFKQLLVYSGQTNFNPQGRLVYLPNLIYISVHIGDS